MTQAVRNTSKNSFAEDVSEAEGPVLVDFHADWCAPCKAQQPILEDIAADLDGRLDVVKLNVEYDHEIADRYGVRGIPTLMLFKGGESVETIVGVTSKEDLLDVVSRHS